jgi:hypothetical protein
MSRDEKKKFFSRRRFLGGSATTVASALLANKVGAQVKDKANDPNAIVSARIHPAIGVARIGNSQEEDGYYIGPEVTEPPLTREGQMRDLSGAIKRQAARFRIYGYNAKGEVVAELTSEQAQIEWNVHLANKKADWYIFDAALDMEEAKSMAVPRRNAKVPLAKRSSLIIDPGSRTISGSNKAGVRFDTGSFRGEIVPLGELKTDHKGRLLVFGGTGYSNSLPRGQRAYDPAVKQTFNNPDGWFDDISDGPVSAKVVINGKEVPVESSWVIVGPPNYAPDMISWRTAYEMLKDCFIEQKMLPRPTRTSFYKDVLPLLQRLTKLQWVNKGFALEFGKGGKYDFEDPAVIAKLADPAQNEFRKQVYRSFRMPDTNVRDWKLWPMMYGDGHGSFNDGPNNYFIISGMHGVHIKRWLEGQFDVEPVPKKARRLSDVPLSEQPAMLDQAALHFCLADAFHPGCEITWPMRHATLYSSPFRIKQRSATNPATDLGDQLTHANVRSVNGPLYGQSAGDITRWMAVPWQGDTIFCRSGYEYKINQFLPSYWPARVPNHVLTEADYKIVTSADPSITREQRLEAFHRRSSWFRTIKTTDPRDLPGLIEKAVTDFHHLGVIEARPGIANDPDFPSVMFVESRPVSVIDEKPKMVGLEAVAAEAMPLPDENDPRSPDYIKAGFDSLEQAKAFRKLKGFEE